MQSLQLLFYDSVYSLRMSGHFRVRLLITVEILQFPSICYSSILSWSRETCYSLPGNVIPVFSVLTGFTPLYLSVKLHVMKILALETATITGSIAILDDSDGLIGESRVNIKIAHSERLMSSVEWLLRASRLSIHDMDAFAVSIGPGSFTGLRIGLSTVKGFCFATNKPIVPVPTLDALAQTLSFCSHLICPMLDARKNEVYTGLYRWGKGILEKIIPETSARPGDFIKNIHDTTVFLGEGVKRYESVIHDALHSRAVFAPDSRMSPSAATVAEIALEKLNRNIHIDPVSLTPFYIRKSEAETRWKNS